MYAVASRLRADVENGIAYSSGLAEKDLIVSHQSEREGVDERVQRVRVVEDDLAADRGDAEGVAVVRDACDDSGEQRAVAPSVFGVRERAEAK